jgi:hypothetical protein
MAGWRRLCVEDVNAAGLAILWGSAFFFNGIVARDRRPSAGGGFAVA